MTDRRKGYEPGKDKAKKGYGKGEIPPRKTYEREKDPAPEGYGKDEDPAPTGYGESEEPTSEGYGEKEPEGYGEDDEPVPEGYGDEEEPAPEGYDEEEEPAPAGYGKEQEEPAPEPYGEDEEPTPRGYGNSPRGGDEGCDDQDYDEPCVPVDPLCDNDPKPGERLLKFKTAKAHAETAKALEQILEWIATDDPAYLANKKAIETAYAAATGKGDFPDNLHKKYCNADKAFKEAMSYLLAKAPGQRKNLLQIWCDRNLCDKGAPVRKLLIERRQVGRRLRNRKGPRELAFQDAHDATVRWEAAKTNWSDPVKNIGAIIKSYEERIGTLKDLFNDKPTADKSILEFLFEVAPLHLGLRPDPVGENEPGIRLVRALLSDFEDVQAWLSNAAQRGQGGLYLIAARDLPVERERVLREWEDAAYAEAEAKAKYDIWPDDAAKLGERYAGLKDDKWLSRVKTAMGPPAPAA